jgi:hypothetical protein
MEGSALNLVNLQGSAIFGPGSEWFWSMAQFVLVAVTLIGIYYQLRIARNANAFEQLRAIVQDWGSERLLRCRVELLRALRDGTDPANLPRGVGVVMLDYWETVALLVRNQHVSRHLVWDDFGNVCMTWWVILKPYIAAVRRDEGDAKIGEHFEWLAGVMVDLDRSLATPPVYDWAFVVSTLDVRLATATDTLRLVRSLRAPIKAEAL